MIGDFFGPNMNKIGNQYNNAMSAATNQYANHMGGYANSGAGANIQNQQLTQAQQPSVGWDVLGQVNNYLDPSIAQMQQDAANQMSAQYGGQGSLFSGAAGKGIAGEVGRIGQQGWGAAFDRAMQDNNRINSLGQQQFNNQMSMDQFNNAARQQNFVNQFGVNNQNFANQNDIQGTVLGQKANAANATAQLQASQKSPWDYLMDVGKLGVGAAGAVTGLRMGIT